MPESLQPFEKLFDALDSVSEILDEGPVDNSEEFLREVLTGIDEARTIAGTLTVADVDAEFTEVEDGES